MVTTAEATESRRTLLVKAVERVSDSVVNIHSEKSSRDQNPGYGQVAARKVNGMGTGIIIDERGYIVTNQHVVMDTDSLRVTLKNRSTYRAELISFDPKHDLAIIKITPSTPLTVAPLGTSTDIMLGETVIAIGNAFGYEHTITEGIVSAQGRDVEVNEKQGYKNLIQTDASINPGNSGGPLVNISGEIIGINTLIRGLSSGIGFAIPSNLARDLSDALIKDGKVVRARIGLVINEFRGATEPGAKNLKGPTVGILVGRTIEGGPAAKADIKTDDIVTHVESTPVANAQQLRNALRNKVGQSVSLSVIRNGKTMKIKVVPELWPDEPPDMVATSSKSNGVQSDDLGVTVKPLTRELARVHGVKLTEGLIVTEVEAGSPAAKRSIKAGTIITEVNGKSVSDLTDFNEALKGADLKKGVRLGTISGGSNKVEVLKSVE